MFWKSRKDNSKLTASFDEVNKEIDRINEIDNDIIANIEFLKLVTSNDFFDMDCNLCLCPRREIITIIENYENLEKAYKEKLNGTL